MSEGAEWWHAANVFAAKMRNYVWHRVSFLLVTQAGFSDIWYNSVINEVIVPMNKNRERVRGEVMRRVIPGYTLSDRMISLVAEITEIATHLGMRESVIDPILRKKNRLKTIHSSLAIEQNTLTLQQVMDIIDGKRAFGEKAHPCRFAA